jgi:hypothetical protein
MGGQGVESDKFMIPWTPGEECLLPMLAVFRNKKLSFFTAQPPTLAIVFTKKEWRVG